MALTVEEGKARRLAGMKQANMGMTLAQRVHRAFVNGRPPSSELRTPLAAVTAARILHREIEAKMTAEGLKPAPGDWGVSIAFITPDLTTLGFTNLYAPSEDAGLMQHLTGNIPLGTVFGIVDPESNDEEARIVMGARPFLSTKQTQEWLSELLTPVRLSIEDEHRSRSHS